MHVFETFRNYFGYQFCLSDDRAFNTKTLQKKSGKNINNYARDRGRNMRGFPKIENNPIYMDVFETFRNYFGYQFCLSDDRAFNTKTLQKKSGKNINNYARDRG